MSGAGRRRPHRDPDATPRPLGELLAEYAERRDLGERLEEGRVHQRWQRIAGPLVSAHARPVRLHGGVLVIEAESATWATELRFLHDELLARARREMGEGMVTSIRVVVARDDDRRGGRRRGGRRR